jgi:hypothetical protein
MESLIFSSPKKYKILEIKELLINNNIPITSIKLYIFVNMDKYSTIDKSNFYDRRENRGDLNMPIEEFNEKLNDNESFEIYTEENYADKAIELIEEYSENNFYNNCIFRSNNYDEACSVQSLLLENNIICDDVLTNFINENIEEYLIFADPELREAADDIIKNKHNKQTYIDEYLNKNDNKANYRKENLSIRILLIVFMILIMAIAIIYSNKESNFIKNVIEIINEIKNIRIN